MARGNPNPPTRQTIAEKGLKNHFLEVGVDYDHFVEVISEYPSLDKVNKSEAADKLGLKDRRAVGRYIQVYAAEQGIEL